MIRYFGIVFFIFLFAVSCKKKEPVETPPVNEKDTTTLISFYNGTISHNQGTNCQSCHQSGGGGKAWFNVSGTVYDSTIYQAFPNATINLYDGIHATGNLIATIEADSFGNFYSTQNIDYGNGLYPEVVGEKISAVMGSAITTGACNKCHGVTTNRIWVK